jgi:hypothetical protein
MQPLTLTPKEARVMPVLAIVGFIIPNGVFCFYVFDSEITKAALRNPISLVFIAEAFFLMFLFAWLLRKLNAKKPNGRAFIVMSLLGSMAFSIPATLHLLFKDKAEK